MDACFGRTSFDADARRQSGASAGVGPGSAPDARWPGEDVCEPIVAWHEQWSMKTAAPLCGGRRHAPSPRRPPLRTLPRDVENRQPVAAARSGCCAAVLAAVSVEIAEFAEVTPAPMDPDSPLESPLRATPARHADTAPPGQPPEDRPWRFAVDGAAAGAETPSFGRAWEAELRVYEDEACTPLPRCEVAHGGILTGRRDSRMDGKKTQGRQAFESCGAARARARVSGERGVGLGRGERDRHLTCRLHGETRCVGFVSAVGTLSCVSVLTLAPFLSPRTLASLAARMGSFLRRPARESTLRTSSKLPPVFLACPKASPVRLCALLASPEGLGG